MIHRDLKPANIKVTPEGKVKVLDLGLAKAYAGDRDKANLSNSPTLSDAATQQGVILGTAAYMSPEQARGKSVDMRADTWAFGCVLFEMLAGQAAFSGRDVTDILAAVRTGVEKPPGKSPWAVLNNTRGKWRLIGGFSGAPGVTRTRDLLIRRAAHSLEALRDHFVMNSISAG